MTEITVVCQASTSMSECARLMREADTNFLPVVDSHGLPIGTVTRRDLEAHAHEPRLERALDVMSRRLLLCNEDEPHHRALELIAKTGAPRVLVIGANGQVVGSIEAETEKSTAKASIRSAPQEIGLDRGRASAEYARH